MKKIIAIMVLLLVVSPQLLLAVAVEFEDSVLRGDGNLISYYRAEDETDETGNHDFTLANINHVGGKFNNAFDCDGTNSFGSTAAYTIGTSYSVCYWVYPDVCVGYPVHKDDIGANRIFSTYVSSSNSSWRIHAWDNNADYEGINADANTCVAEIWQHLCFVWDTPNSLISIYKNGSSIKSGVLDDDAEQGNVRVAMCSQDDGVNDFDGQLDDIEIFDRALTAAEVECIALGTSCPGAPPAAPVVEEIADALFF